MNLLVWPSCAHFIGAWIVCRGGIISLIELCDNKRATLYGNSLHMQSLSLKFLWMFLSIYIWLFKYTKLNSWTQLLLANIFLSGWKSDQLSTCSFQENTATVDRPLTPPVASHTLHRSSWTMTVRPTDLHHIHVYVYDVNDGIWCHIYVWSCDLYSGATYIHIKIYNVT